MADADRHFSDDSDEEYEAVSVVLYRTKHGFDGGMRLDGHLQHCMACRSLAIANLITIIGGAHQKLMADDAGLSFAFEMNVGREQ